MSRCNIDIDRIRCRLGIDDDDAYESFLRSGTRANDDQCTAPSRLEDEVLLMTTCVLASDEVLFALPCSNEIMKPCEPDNPR